ncbi:type III effector HrpK [Phyllobacterium sp. 21LDTY02-6]|uniref:type III effector HrpK domain-containing protein n=1 Tax=Phyllobacterium sp. 21LDTY02-6 TaxID=2944903 RepID=UPI002020DF02|nr:type III effector HrpK domain-containing protein [Phyllobacterium sp. 21LDTY02-6]MCO4318566.1 type III effector HrpK [Phyllobacterium sp. 21LDTY02-6]
MSKVIAPTNRSNLATVDPDTAKAWDEAQKAAKDAGIIWERPKNDNRSAEDIINDTQLLRDLGNQSGVKDMLKDRVGDFEKDANAAFRAAQILEHVERFDESGKKVAGKDVDNGRIDGFTNSGEARHGTEAGRLQDFGKYGFSNLKGKLNEVSTAGDDKEARDQAAKLGIKWVLPDDDKRSAQDIIDDSDLLKNLGNQSGVKDMLKDRVGDFEKDADAAYRAAQLLEHVERLDESGKRIAGNDVDNGSIDGFTNSGEARHGTEAGRLQDFGKYGFSNLKGKLTDVSTAGDDKEAREQAEKVGIKWELPDDDKRSAQDIIDDSPLLKNLGNQSGVKDMLKERVGDFEKDADAAYRASQVLDRITMYDEKGNSLSGSDVSNTSIDGFTKSGEAYNGTEAGRLQDFGKYGFEVLKDVKKPEDISSYKDFLKANPDADDTSKTLAKYAAIIGENYDAIKGKTGVDGDLTADALKKYRDENPQISDDFKEALNFWAQPGAFEKLETAHKPLEGGPDGGASKDDLKSWIDTQAPKDSGSAIAFISSVANANITADVDTSKLGADVFENPDKYSAKEKAAVLQDLLTAQSLITQGASAGMWRDDYGKVSIANDVRSHPDPQKLLEDVNDHIAILEGDKAVVDFLNENSSKQFDALFKSNEGLKTAVEASYDDIKSGKALDSLWDAKTKDGKTDQQAALAEFYGSAKMYQQALGIDKPGEIQDAVNSSKHKGDFQDFYEKSLVSGDRFNELLKDNTFEEAASAFSTEVALYNAALDPDFTGKFDSKLNENFSDIVEKNAFKDATFDDLKTAFGVDGGDKLDEEKVKSYIDQIAKDNPELLVNQDGTVAKSDQILAGFRGSWDVLRQGTKSLAELNSEWLNPSAKAAADKGVLHGVSGLFMAGVTISKGVQSGGNPTERQKVDITTGSIQTATLLTEGGIKAWKQYLKDVADKHPDTAIGKKIGKMSDENFKSLTDNWNRAENAAKGIGGLAGVVAGAYGIFDGVQSIRKGDKVGGGISITAGSLGALAGLASAVEGGLGVFAPSVLRTIPIAGAAGVLGLAAAGVGVIAMLLPGLIEEGKHQARQDKFGSLLSDYLTQYEIDGVPYGDISDIPDEDWPGYEDGPTIGS